MTKAIIGSHSNVAGYIWEMPFWNELQPRYKGKGLNKDKFTKIALELLESEPLLKSDVPISQNEFLKFIDTSREYHIEELYGRFASLYLKNRARQILAIKNPTIELYADEVFKNIPDTIFIHVLRNPLDNYVSLKKAGEKWWNQRFSILKHIYDWKNSYKKGRSNCIKYPGRYYMIKYEDIISEPRNSILTLCNYLKLDFQEEMLEMKDQPGWSGSNSSLNNNQNSNILYSHSIGTYKSFLSNKVINTYMQLLQKELKESNYLMDRSTPKSNKFLQIRFNLLSLFLSIRARIKTRLKRTVIFSFYKRLTYF